MSYPNYNQNSYTNFNNYQQYQNQYQAYQNPYLQQQMYMQQQQIMQNKYWQNQNRMQANQGNNSEFPESLKAYIMRAYKQCQNQSQQVEIEQLLRNIINTSKLNNSLFTKDWDNEPLPVTKTYNYLETLNNIQQDISKFRRVKDLKKNKQKSEQNTENLQEAQQEEQVKQEEKQVEKKVEKQEKRKSKFQNYGIDVNNQKVQLSTLETLNTVQRLKQLNQKIYKDEDEDFEEASKYIIQGTSTALEKKYLRLTSKPDPWDIRPEQYLKKSLEHILSKWKSGSVDYGFMQEQFKSIRQDMIVQHIVSPFSIQLIETNARIALECQDIKQYQYSTNHLNDLYKQFPKDGNRLEFLSYKALVFLCNGQLFQVSGVIREFSEEDLQNEFVQFTFNFMKIIRVGNFIKAIQLQNQAPGCCKFIIRFYLYNIRVQALTIMLRSFINQEKAIKLKGLFNQLGFKDEEELRNFLIEQKAILTEDEQALSKESSKVFIDILYQIKNTKSQIQN